MRDRWSSSNDYDDNDYDDNDCDDNDHDDNDYDDNDYDDNDYAGIHTYSWRIFATASSREIVLEAKGVVFIVIIIIIIKKW